ncbi:MAG: hypothetical protein K9J13_07745 [Saprospiraceae bacterium]|nr:hypothetical protein [Saprospiraceae bacterium]
MKTIVGSLLLILLLSCGSSKNQNELIRIEHSGICDKPIFTIIISTKATSVVHSEFNYVVKNESYSVVENTISDFYEKKCENEIYEYGSFKISVIESNGKAYNYKLNRNESINLFVQIIKDLRKTNGNKDLISQLENTLKRINFDKKVLDNY